MKWRAPAVAPDTGLVSSLVRCSFGAAGKGVLRGATEPAPTTPQDTENPPRKLPGRATVGTEPPQRLAPGSRVLTVARDLRKHHGSRDLLTRVRGSC